MYKPKYTEGITAPLISWRAIFGGAVIALGITVLLTTLWLAIAAGEGAAGAAPPDNFVQDNLTWFIGGTAVFTLFVGGWLAGWLAGLRGAVSGIVNGLTVWSLFLLASIAVGIPSALNFVNVSQLGPTGESAAWGTFWASLIGFVVAGVGGMLGGAITMRRVSMVQAAEEPYIEPEERRRGIA